MSKTDAAYMREYRARKKAEHAAGVRIVGLTATKYALEANRLEAENARLSEEVRHLKEELAKRPDSVIARVGGRVVDSVSFNSRPFTPVPKKGK